MPIYRNPLPGVPPVESPFFDEIFVPGRFSELECRIARDLHDKGFAVFDFPDPELTARAEDCANFTPMNSDPFRGLLAFRQQDIVANEPVVNVFSNKAVPASFIESTKYGFEPLARIRHKLWRRRRRQLKSKAP